ncbi:MAG: redox-regulated ATPase YchF [Ignavibacteria bacterium RIFOXYB2_FULL_35_12]|nr:MAG: redox-regulated ATPase YchF [Ignavibacteria bacterium GWA2_36_19]OGU55727.1 MAG: redox-regulated ATPase YchF [Ignavibacteria bacterium GWC2_35_8]OGU56334.1 MAG: redox-regulated ATPase YchF [Ignavibacteria bacterium GWF2_35_20]OGU80567.1 MAG: redox-regulated ATPase YchF [Ignavibacteria bacterium RIFOXYA2_FULL_35_9]OGU94163.1 MAG: redox-regulated ATPase YchF [Ignavibacteria bacterium RIFOXYB12_FULL_35_14]OGV01474.1 MAG: redox-regulated ATPase YchF [Ignavibacteria bacterium RIFOXYC2_FULL_
MQIGIVGLPFSGKTTLFQTITKTLLDTSHLSRPETHLAVIKVPDSRLDKLTGIFNPKKKVNATIEFIDVAGLKSDESGSVKFSGNFLGNVKNNDALILVVRLFKDESVTPPEGSIDMMRDINMFETEFILSDLAIVEKRIESLKKQIQKTQDDLMKRELALLEKCNVHLQNEKPLRDSDLSKDELAILKTYQLLSIKPLLIALNLDESQVKEKDSFLDELVKTKIGKHSKALAFFGKIEFEMSELSEDDAKLFMSEFGINESALNGIIREAYSLLGLQSFFTVGEDECRAWTIRKGMNAQEAAGEIHTDFFNKFIRAEVVHYDDFIKCGSFAKAKEMGVWRLEGKEYIVKDGDIISVRHS